MQKDSFGINLPPEDERLTNVNFDLKPKARPLLSAPLVGTEMIIPAIEGLEGIEEHLPIPGFDEDDEMDMSGQLNGDDSGLGKRGRDDDEEEDEEE